MIWSLMRATASSTTVPLGVMGAVTGSGGRESVEAGSKLAPEAG